MFSPCVAAFYTGASVSMVQFRYRGQGPVRSFSEAADEASARPGKYGSP